MSNLTENSGELEAPGVTSAPQSASFKIKFLKFLRRVHLYAGLFLLPWVFLYGITGAMYNHQGLFPAGESYSVDDAKLQESALKDIPSPAVLAKQVVESIQKAKPNSNIKLSSNHHAAFNNDIILETRVKGKKHVVHINPVDHSAWITAPPQNEELGRQHAILRDVRNIKLNPNPYQKAKEALPDIMSGAGLGNPTPAKPLGWCKLNFLAEVDGETARVTYVLRDGHVDMTRFTGEDGMIPRATFLRMHTFHGRTPDASARNVWSFFIDLMALAMVTWGITGMVMWWQMKKLRKIGSLVLACSIITACVISFYLSQFHALTKM